MKILNNIEKIVAISQSIINSEIHMIEGVRELCALHASLPPSEQADFYTLKAVDSETDHFPLGTMRCKCSETHLLKADEEMRAYLDDQSGEIIEACENIIKFYKKTNQHNA